MKMKIFIFFCLFFLLASEAIISYEEYASLAEKKQWPNTAEAFNAYKEYCQDPTSTPPSILPEITRSDCDTTLAASNYPGTTTVESTSEISPTSTTPSDKSTLPPTFTKENMECVDLITTTSSAMPTESSPKETFAETTMSQTLPSSGFFTSSATSEISTSFPFTPENIECVDLITTTSSPTPQYHETTESIQKDTSATNFAETTFSQPLPSTEFFTSSAPSETSTYSPFTTENTECADCITTTSSPTPLIHETTERSPKEMSAEITFGQTLPSTEFFTSSAPSETSAPPSFTTENTECVDLITTTSSPTPQFHGTTGSSQKDTSATTFTETIIGRTSPSSKLFTSSAPSETSTSSPFTKENIECTDLITSTTTSTKTSSHSKAESTPEKISTTTSTETTSLQSQATASNFFMQSTTSEFKTDEKTNTVTEKRSSVHAKTTSVSYDQMNVKSSQTSTSKITAKSSKISSSTTTNTVKFEPTTVTSPESPSSTDPKETTEHQTVTPLKKFPSTQQPNEDLVSKSVTETTDKPTSVTHDSDATVISLSSKQSTAPTKTTADVISNAAVTSVFPYTSTSTTTTSTSTTIKSASTTTEVTKPYMEEGSTTQALITTTSSYPTTLSSNSGAFTTTTPTPIATATLMEASTAAASKITQTISPTSDILSTQERETTTAEAHVTVTSSTPTTQTSTFSNIESTPLTNPLLHTTTSSASTFTESKTKTRPTKSGTYTAKFTTTTSLTTVKETTEDKKPTQKLIDKTLTSLVTSPSKTQSSTTVPQTVKEEQETTIEISLTSEVAPLAKLSTQETTVSTSTSFSTTEVSDNKQITETPTKGSDLIAKTDVLSSSTETSAISSTKDNGVTMKSTITLEQILESSPLQTYAASITSSPSPITTTSTTTESPQTTSTTEAPEPTKEPVDCQMPCPIDFFEGDYACFTFIQPKDEKAWKYSDFVTACDLMDGIVSSLSDFEYAKNMELFKKIALTKKMILTTVFTNTVPTPNIAARRVINGIDFSNSNSTKISTIQLSSGKKYSNSSAVCRVGKFCEEYTCPIREFFVVESARYFETDVPLTKVLKTGESLNVECVGNPKRTFALECDRHGYLIPDSSMLKCEGSGIKSEVVKSCGECDIQQTESCQGLRNGSFVCNCKQSYYGKTCKNIVDACVGFTCQNGGTCLNEYSNAKCQCKTSHYGDRCQYDFYKSEGPARVMRAITNAAVVIVIIDEVVRTRQKYILPAEGKSGTLPTEVCRFFTTMMGAMAFVMKLLYEFPDSGKMEEKYYCQTHFEMTITFCFYALTGMIGESVISLGVITNKMTNQFKGRCKDRKNCIGAGKLFILINLVASVPTAIIWQKSSQLVTPRSCIGCLPWENTSDQQQIASILLVALMTFYALTASCLALFARQFLDQNNLETRRRWDADRSGPFAYGREILPIENNVRYYLLALRPIFFAGYWFAMVASTELMIEWVSGLATVVGLIYSVINFIQNNFAFRKDLEGWINSAMSWLPKEYSPKMNKISLHSRQDYLKIYDPEALEKEAAELIEQRDQYLRAKYILDDDFEKAKQQWSAAAEVRYPVVYEQPIEHLMLADRNRWLNAASLRIMMPAGLRAVIQKQWTLIYLRARAAGRPRSGAMAAIFKQLQPPRLFTYGYRRSIFDGMYRVFWENMTIIDQLEGVKDLPREKVIEVYQRGVQMLTIKPNRKIERAEILNPENSDGQTLKFQRSDPLMNIDQQQKVFDMLENLCNSITVEMMLQDEAISRALFESGPQRYGINRDVLTENTFDNYPTSLWDFLLNEQRPNFVGPRTIENVLAPGVDHLTHTAWFWMMHNGLIWQRVTTQAKYLAFFIQIKKDNAEISKNNNSWRNHFPFNWFNKNENAQQPRQAYPEPEDDLHVEDPIGLN